MSQYFVEEPLYNCSRKLGGYRFVDLETEISPFFLYNIVPAKWATVNILPQTLNRIYVWTLTGPFQHYSMLSSEPSHCSSGYVFSQHLTGLYLPPSMCASTLISC